MSAISRRSVALGLVALPLVPGGASANDDPDAELRRLWAEYQAQEKKAEELHEPCRAKYEAFDAENIGPYNFPDGHFPSPAHHAAYERQYIAKRKVASEGWHDEWGAWSDACSDLNRIAKAIRETPAHTFFGLGVKLVAFDGGEYQDQSYIDVLHAALADIDRVTGEEFRARLEPLIEITDDDA